MQSCLVVAGCIARVLGTGQRALVSPLARRDGPSQVQKNNSGVTMRAGGESKSRRNSSSSSYTSTTSTSSSNQQRQRKGSLQRSRGPTMTVLTRGPVWRRPTAARRWVLQRYEYLAHTWPTVRRARRPVAAAVLGGSATWPATRGSKASKR